MASRTTAPVHSDAAQVNTAVTTDGFKNDAAKDRAGHQHHQQPQAEAAPTIGEDSDVQVIEGDGQQQVKKKGDKGTKVPDAESADEKGQQQGKLRGMFGRLKKGSEEGEEASETKVKIKGDAQ